MLKLIALAPTIHAVLLAVGCWSTASVAHAAPLSQSGQWLRPSADPASAPRDDAHASRLAQGPGRVDVHAWYEASFDVPRDGSYVIDFQSSSTIASFRHFVFDARGVLLATHQGGITHAAPGPFPMRHGRELTLPRGRYHLRTELRSPFLLGLPEPYVEDVASYRQAIKAGNTLALLGLGVLLGLGFYYAALALLRWRAADAMYTVFIAGNVLYNGTALLVFGDLLGWRWFYLVSVPILFSNAAYVVFVMSLLDVERGGHPRLYRLGQLLLGVFVAFVLVAALRPAWSLELDRLGVALFSSYGLAAAVARARDGHPSARLYLVAVGAFFLLAFVSISLSRMTTQAVYIEHLGLLAVVVEAGLLALVLAHQFSVLRSERDSAEHRAREGHRAAHSDALTGLPNRKALDIELSELPEQGCLTFIDLDGLKHYNDKYGHQRGDELLCSFADELHTRLGDLGTLFRLSGDEFAITCPCGEQPRVEACLAATIEALRAARFRLAGASSGTVHVREDPGRIALKHTADTRMYEDKRRRRPSVMAEWTRESSPPDKRAG